MSRCWLVLCAALLLTPVEVNAQTRALENSKGRAVFVIDGDRREWQGRLVRVSADALELESDAGIRTFKLAELRRVDADGDGIRDGFLKGFLAGALLSIGWALEGDAQWLTVASGVSYGMIGALIDAGCSSRHPVFHGGGAPHADAITERFPPVGIRIRW